MFSHNFSVFFIGLLFRLIQTFAISLNILNPIFSNSLISKHLFGQISVKSAVFGSFSVFFDFIIFFFTVLF